MAQKVDVIIPTFNRSSHLLKTLFSFKDQSYSQFKIIVVNDGSIDDLSGEIRTIASHFQIVYHRIEHRGRAGARNHGLKHSDGQIVLFFDDHSQPCPNLIEEHVKNHMKYKKYGAFRGRIEYKTDYDSHIRYQKSRFLQDLHHKFYANNPIIDFGTHNLSVKREVLNAIGNFDENFTAYGAEDQEFGIRLRKAGFRIGYLQKALAYNIRIPKESKDTIWRAVESGKMAALLIKKHPRYRFSLGINLFNKILYDRKKNYKLYIDYFNKKKIPKDISINKKTKFIFYYYSFMENYSKVKN